GERGATGWLLGAATIMLWRGVGRGSAAVVGYAWGWGLWWRATWAPSTASRGSPPYLAMFTISATLPLESVASTNFFLRRVSPGTESGHGSRRCQARFRWSISGSERPLIPNWTRSVSWLSRWRLSSFVHGRRLLRTSSMAG